MCRLLRWRPGEYAEGTTDDAGTTHHHQPTSRRGSIGCPGAGSTGWCVALGDRLDPRRAGGDHRRLAGRRAVRSPLHLSGAEVGAAASAYSVGAVAGALFFGWLTDRLGRKRLFSVTVLVYLLATLACGLAWNFWSFALFRLITGRRHRRRIRGGERHHPGADPGAAARLHRPGGQRQLLDRRRARRRSGALVVLDPAIMPPEIGWRAAFVIGGVLGFIVLLLRRFLPESPRWLMTHGQPEEAERVVRGDRGARGARKPARRCRPCRRRR